MTNISRFGEESSKIAIKKFDSLAEALQELCKDCLRYTYPNFYVFPTLGRDGAIDGIQEDTWAECKICSENKSSAVIQKWTDTEKSLRTQLAKGQTNCQKQYLPWFSSKNKIKKYIIFTNAQLPNENAVQEIIKYVSNVFNELSQISQNLKHLAHVEIEIWDWGKIKPVIQENTDLLYKWYWETWPQGMVPFKIEQESGFRSYLDYSKLSYYSLSDFEKESGEKCPIKTEKEILNSFDKTNKIGKIIIGPAGVGKTRLALQVGELATKEKWIVFKINAASIKVSSIECLFEKLKESDRVLLIIDYVELMENFKIFTEEINNYNTQFGKKVFYIATVRQSFYHKILSEEATHESITLETNPLDMWMIKYMEMVVTHILKTSKIPCYEEYIPICNKIPVLAVLIIYLYQNKESTNITELLTIKDFGIWLSKHLKLTLPFTENSLVAKFMLCLPISEKVLEKIPPEIEEIKNKLSTDGWIESPQEDNKKRYAIHDIISDKIVISYCYTIRPEIKYFVKSAFDFATKFNSLGSIIVAFERINECEPLINMDWYSLITNEVTRNPSEWKQYRLKLLITSLLNESQQIMLFAEIENYWTDLYSEPLFHQALGWLIGWLCREENKNSERVIFLRKIIEPFISPSLKHIKNNYLICRAIEFNPKKYSNELFEWIEKNKDSPKLSFVLCAYIRSNYNNELIEEKLKEWFKIHPTDFESYHVLQALFKSGRKSDIETNWLNIWLQNEDNWNKSGKLIGLYTKAGGDISHLKEFFLKKIRKDDEYSIHAIQQYVRNFKEIGVIEKNIINISIKENLNEHLEDIINQLISKKCKLSINLKKYSLNWCKLNCKDPNNLWNLKKLLWNNYDDKIVNEFIKIFEITLSNLNLNQLPEDNCSNVRCILYELLNKNYKSKTRYNAILDCYKKCLEKNNLFKGNKKMFSTIQHPTFLYALKKMFINGKLDVNKDVMCLINFISWYNGWDPENKAKSKKIIKQLIYKNPSNIWNQIK
jgi:hypothetical protein